MESIYPAVTAPVGRFAPTPSGRMHLGNLFAAMLAWASVRKNGGRIILRIEDLDTERCTVAFADLVKSDLEWLGLDWDEETPPQRDRGHAYAAALKQLDEQGLVYPCWCTRGLLHAASAPHAEDGHSVYPGFCRNLSPEERDERAGRPASTRLLVPDETITFIDGLQGPYSENLARDCGDFVVRKADGGWAYQLAVVVDDIASGVTEVVRDRDLDVGLLRERLGPEQLLGRLAHIAGLTDEYRPLTAAELADLFDWGKVRRDDIEVDPAKW